MPPLQLGQVQNPGGGHAWRVVVTLRDFPPCAQEPLPAAADWTVTVQNKAEPLTAWTEPACSPALSPARDTGVWLRAAVTRAPRVWRCRPRHSGSRGAEPPIPLVRTNRREHTLGAGVCLSPGASRSCGLSPSPTPRRTALQLSLGRRLMKGICELCLPGQSANKPDSHCLHPPFIGPPRPLFQAPSPGSSRRPAGTPGSAGVDCLPAALGVLARPPHHLGGPCPRDPGYQKGPQKAPHPPPSPLTCLGVLSLPRVFLVFNKFPQDHSY